MTLFRSHREFLDDAMKTVVEVSSMEELERYVDKGPLYVEKYGRPIDERIGWNTHIVTDTHGYVVGFTNGPLT